MDPMNPDRLDTVSRIFLIASLCAAVVAWLVVFAQFAIGCAK